MPSLTAPKTPVPTTPAPSSPAERIAYQQALDERNAFLQAQRISPRCRL